MTELKLYNTLTRRKDPLKPLAVNPANGKPMVRMYVCGPTVYDYAHIGNARPVIVFDVLFRLLRHVYGAENVVYARNITDVDDKINARAARDYPGLPLNDAIRKVTEGTNAQYQKDTLALGNLPPTTQPRATDHLDEMRAIIERLIAKGFAYVAEEHVLFSPGVMNAAANSSEVGAGSREEFASTKNNHNGELPRYGAFSKRSLDELLAGARVDVATYKRDPMDFVLWKPSEPGQPGWPSPAGIKTPGRPGWHIECSAMSMKQLLEPFGGGLACDDPVKNTFDIHGGGIDLVFPHHENEIAQSCCAFGSSRMAEIWMHNGFLQVEGEKMSKSLGNFFTIAEVLADWQGEVARLNMLRTHYRQPIDWTVASLKESAAMLDGWYRKAGDAPAGAIDKAVFAALADDLNTPAAIAALHQIDDPGTLKASAALLGLLGENQEEREARSRAGIDAGKVESLIAARITARNAKNWAESDRLRDELVSMGIQIMDSKDPVTGELKTTWEVKR